MRSVINIKGNGNTYKNDALARYMSNIAKYPVLTADQELEVVLKYKSGDVSQKEVLINSNQRFVLSVAKTYTSDPDLVLDLISEGNIGLSEAIDRFDPTRGFKFISYGVWYIRKCMSAYIQKNSLVVDKKSQAIKSTISKMKKKFFDENGFDMPEYMVLDKIREISGRAFNCEDSVHAVSVRTIDSYKNDEINSDSSPLDMWVCSHNSVEKTFDHEDKTKVVKLLMDKSLDARSREIIDASFGLTTGNPMSDYEIGYKMDMSSERVRQIRKKAIDKMKIKAYRLKINLQF